MRTNGLYHAAYLRFQQDTDYPSYSEFLSFCRSSRFFFIK